MSHSFNAKTRFSLENVDDWRADPEGNERKFGKTQSSVRRQRTHGATVEDVRAKVLRLHRMSTDFDGNGSTHRLKQSIGLAPVAPEFTPEPYAGADHYSSHPDTPADLPTTDEARLIRDEIRAAGTAMQRHFRGMAEAIRTGVPPAPAMEETAEERIRYAEDGRA